MEKEIAEEMSESDLQAIAINQDRVLVQRNTLYETLEKEIPAKTVHESDSDFSPR